MLDLIMTHIAHCDLIESFGDSMQRETHAIKDHNDFLMNDFASSVTAQKML